MAERRWQFWIDVGGTFTDCIGVSPAGELRRHKTLSSGSIKGVVGRDSSKSEIFDPLRRRDSPNLWRGYELWIMGSGSSHGDDVPNSVVVSASTLERLLLASPLNETPQAGSSYELRSTLPAPLVAIRYLLGLPPDRALPPMDVRLGTTRGTNALLTRTGSKTALVTTRGLGDVLAIGYQARPDLFQLTIRKSLPLYDCVVELDERIDAAGSVLTPIDPAEVRRQIQSLRGHGVESVAVCLLHACANPAHELVVAEIATQAGFASISVSHDVSSIRKLVPRGDTTVVDAYLNPVLRAYVRQVQEELHPDSRLQIMTSSGGLVASDQFRGRDSILSGPAGGVVGVARCAEATGFATAIGFDMGGTSTDVSRWDGSFPLTYETEKAGVRVTAPMMAIETVAAGGGSLCQFDGVKLTVGPASAGAYPGPACYGAGGPLAITDMNLALGKILPDAFPFPLSLSAVQDRLAAQCREILQATGREFTLTELAEGYLRVANTSMVEAIRCVTVARGNDPRGDLLVAFGGAAGQHCCAIASELGMRQVLLHPSAGILSALGTGLAAVTVHRERGVYEQLERFLAEHNQPYFHSMRTAATRELKTQTSNDVAVRYFEALDLRFVGLDAPTTIARPDDGDFRQAYERDYQARCGYLPASREIEVVTARLSAVAVTNHALPRSSRVSPRQQPLATSRQSPVLFDGTWHDAAIFPRETLQPGDRITGPAIVTDDTSTIVVDPNWRAEVLSEAELLLIQLPESGSGSGQSQATSGMSQQGMSIDSGRSISLSQPDPVLLEVFNQRFAAIATQMGTTLQTNSRSVNVKERLDFSCAIFTATGDLVVNAPHIPVHLGAMSATVRHVLQTLPLQPGDAVVTNDPYHGGSHLPDVTVISPVHDEATGKLLFFTASRAHHAEIGGITPGSMPPFSTNLAEEGVLLRAMKVMDRGESRLDALRQQLTRAKYPSRNVAMNLADVTAQLAANRQGANSLLQFVDKQSWPVVEAYMRFIQDAAEQKLRHALARMPQRDYAFTDYLDDGSPIAVLIAIQNERATIDFTGTGPVLPGNLNANRAIVSAAVMYCLRCLIDEPMPLNEGVLAPITLVIPECLLNPPSQADPARCPAIVGGNVETSQRVVDVILGALGLAAASQGTMNNLLFGNASFGYYETICGGVGATSRGPGADAVHSHMTNTRLTDPEILESRFPVRLRRFAIRRGSGGPGQHRGGDGVIREIEFLQPLTLSLLTQRRGKFAPYGGGNGGAGQCGVNTMLWADGTETRLPGIASVEVTPGDTIRLETPGGGGWG